MFLKQEKNQVVATSFKQCLFKSLKVSLQFLAFQNIPTFIYFSYKTYIFLAEKGVFR